MFQFFIHDVTEASSAHMNKAWLFKRKSPISFIERATPKTETNLVCYSNNHHKNYEASF